MNSSCEVLKNIVFLDAIASLAELKARIAQHLQNITTDTLRSIVEHAVYRFQLVAEIGGKHIEYFFHVSRPFLLHFLALVQMKTKQFFPSDLTSSSRGGCVF